MIYFHILSSPPSEGGLPRHVCVNLVELEISIFSIIHLLLFFPVSSLLASRIRNHRSLFLFFPISPNCELCFRLFLCPICAVLLFFTFSFRDCILVHVLFVLDLCALFAISSHVLFRTYPISFIRLTFFTCPRNCS